MSERLMLYRIGLFLCWIEMLPHHNVSKHSKSFQSNCKSMKSRGLTWIWIAFMHVYVYISHVYCTCDTKFSLLLGFYVFRLTTTTTTTLPLDQTIQMHDIILGFYYCMRIAPIWQWLTTTLSYTLYMSLYELRWNVCANFMHDILYKKKSKNREMVVYDQ